MDSNQVISVSRGRLVGNILLALLIGTLLPFIAIAQVSLLAPVLMLCGIFAVRMKVRVGWVPAITLFGAAVGSFVVFMGEALSVALVLAAVLPAVFCIRAMPQKKPFFEQMKGGILAYGLGLVAAMLALYLMFGGNMIARFVDLIRQEFARMPDAALQPVVDALNSAFTLSGVRPTELFTVEIYRAQLAGVLDLMQQTYAQALPGALLSGALLSGVLTVLWGNWTMARLGLATNESFVGMSGWFLPGQVSIGALALWIVGFILAVSRYNGGATVYQAVCQLSGSIFAIQALSALDRRMLRGGASLSRRKVMISLLTVAALLLSEFALVLSVIGTLSAFFGSHGVFKRPLNGEHDDQSDRDDPQE